MKSSFSLLAAAALLMAAPLANADGGYDSGYISSGYSVLIHDPEKTGNTTFQGFDLSGGFLLADHHELSLQTGFYFGDQGIYRTFNERSHHGNDSRDSYGRNTYLLPFMLSYNFVQKFGSDDNLILKGGPVGAMFVAIGSEHWGHYDSRRDNSHYYSIDDEEYDDGWSTKKTHTEGDVFWGAGAQASAALRLTDHCYVNLGYRFLCASSYEVFGTKTGRSYNHQITLSFQLKF
jgi:hypothetical protein